MTDTEALNAIAEILSGTEWDAATVEAVAEVVRLTGRAVNDVTGED